MPEVPGMENTPLGDWAKDTEDAALLKKIAEERVENNEELEKLHAVPKGSAPVATETISDERRIQEIKKRLRETEAENREGRTAAKAERARKRGFFGELRDRLRESNPKNDKK